MKTEGRSLFVSYCTLLEKWTEVLRRTQTQQFHISSYDCKVIFVAWFHSPSLTWEQNFYFHRHRATLALNERFYVPVGASVRLQCSVYWYRTIPLVQTFRLKSCKYKWF